MAVVWLREEICDVNGPGIDGAPLLRVCRLQLRSVCGDVPALARAIPGESLCPNLRRVAL
jgi:hypothetical protein